MASSNVILNGGFEGGHRHWDGQSKEFGLERYYLGNGDRNKVAEMDGRTDDITVFEQTFTIDVGQTTDITFDAGLNATHQGAVAGSDGFTLEILDSDGNVVMSQDVFPDTNELHGYSIPVTFPEGGEYTLRLTELGTSDDLGALVDNVSIIAVDCFTRGTKIDTSEGEKAVEDICIGDQVRTLDSGLQTVRWIGVAKRRAIGAMAPVKFCKGALGNNRDLLVSPEHRMLISGWQAEVCFGEPEVLVSAKSLINDKTVYRVYGGVVEYFHLLFDKHEIVFAEGAASESYYPTQASVSALDDATQQELFALFPQLSTESMGDFGQAARASLSMHEACLISLPTEA